MGSTNDNWLPHLSPEVISETEGNYLDAYVVALEGWRRGLTLKWHVKDSEKFKEMKTWFVEQPGQLFSLHSKERSHYFFRTRGDKVPNEAVEQGMDKEKTKETLSQAKVPVPQGRRFTGEYAENDIVNYATSLGFPVVIKPTDGSFGRGVTSNIKNIEELKPALQYLQNELQENDIIVEKHIQGKDYRLYVVGDKVVGAILRVPPNVIGDGVNTLESLIKHKNIERSVNPRLVSCPIRTDNETVKYLSQFGYDLETIPAKGKILYTSNKANISLGGDPIDVLDELSLNTKKTAIQAMHAIPGMEHGAVDLMIETSPNGEEISYVIELNPTAQLGGILYPLQGQPRDAPGAIIDYYFPETKNNIRNTQIHFEFQKVLLPLNRGVAQVTKVTPCPRENIIARKLVLKGDFSETNIVYWLWGTMNELSVDGLIEVHNKSTIEIIVLGNDSSIQQLKAGLGSEHTNVEIHRIKESTWKEPVKLGVEIIDARNNLMKDIKELQKGISKIQRKQQNLEKDYNNMLNSNSWKITGPIRNITVGVKKLVRRT